MPEAPSPALQVLLAYYEAWSGRDLDQAMEYIAEDIVCDAPAGRIEGKEAYRAFLEPFIEMLQATELFAAFGDDQTALMMYGTQTALVADAPGAECVTVENGKNTRSRFLFDRAPFEAARRAAGSS